MEEKATGQGGGSGHIGGPEHHPAADQVVELVNPDAGGDFLIVCEHASKAIPNAFNNLGLDSPLSESHIAWDPGAREVALEVARILDAPLVAQRFSRLLYDCNRGWEALDVIPTLSEIHDVPGNVGLTSSQRKARHDAYYLPFHQAISGRLDHGLATGRKLVVVTIHSFTPVYRGVRRSLDIGIVHDTDSRFADALLRACAADRDKIIHRNEPYGPQDGVTHTLREHGVNRKFLNVMIEIRNSLIKDSASQKEMATRLAGRLAEALDYLIDQPAPGGG